MTILDSIREMLTQTYEAEGLPAEVEIRMPRAVVLALIRHATSENRHGDVVISSDPDSPWLRSFEEWGAISIRPLEAR